MVGHVIVVVAAAALSASSGAAAAAAAAAPAQAVTTATAATATATGAASSFVTNSKCTMYPKSGVTTGHDVGRASVTSAQDCLQACERNSLCCMGEFDSTHTKCYLKSGGQIVAIGRRAGSAAFNCTGAVNTCYHPVGPHPPPPPTPAAPSVPVTVAVALSAPGGHGDHSPVLLLAQLAGRGGGRGG
eukprot:COSAG01_NODE_12766_length_1689_cov_0.991195_1_plen_187_part_00